MKVLYYSDIHDETRRNESIPGMPDRSLFDLIILAGDISSASKIRAFLINVHEECQRPIIFVLGNHEFYGGRDIDRWPEELKKSLSIYPDIHVLSNDHVDIEDIRFIGSTFWTNFEAGDGKADEYGTRAEQQITDFSEIICRHQRITSMVMQARHNQSKRIIDKKLDCSPAKLNVVITHFPPSHLLANPKFQKDALTYYFNTDSEDLIYKYKPQFWFYGHNHYSQHLQIDSTICCSNQPGYFHEGKFKHEIVNIRN